MVHIANYNFMDANIKIFNTPELLADSFAEYFANEVNKSERYNIALSGGSTPKIIFETLAKNYSDKIEWAKVHFFWGDERCVPPDSDESNYKMAKKFLFDKIKIPSGNIHRIKGEIDPAEEALRYSNIILENLPVKNNLPRFDFVMLGLGEDGHTASIFPDRLELFESEKICEKVKNPLTKQNRITITGKVINNSAVIAFFVTGGKKSNIAGQILNNSTGRDYFPAAHIIPSNGELIWYLDKECSSELVLKEE